MQKILTEKKGNTIHTPVPSESGYLNLVTLLVFPSLPRGSAVENLPANAGYMDLIPGLRRSPGEGNGNPLQYSCLRNPLDRGAWWAIIQKVTKSQED